VRASSGRRHRSALPALLLLALLLPVLAAEPAALLEFIYIDANVGGSSGGHVALKTGDSVYHYQNDDGYIRLTRESWDRFHFVYNDIDNRNIHIAKLRVDESAAERVRDRLGLLFMVQNRHADFLEALDRDAALLRRLAQSEPFEMRGIGFFDRRPHESSALHELNTEITRRLGAAFAEAERRRLARQIVLLAYPSEPAPDPAPEEDRYPRYPPSFSEQVEDLYSRWFALTAIREEWPLRDGLLIDAAAPGGTALSEGERRWLAAYRERLADAVLASLQANPAGSGYPLLLALARYAAISESLATGRLLVLDALPPAYRAERFTRVQEQRGSLNLLLSRLQAELPPTRRAVFALEEPDESAYSQLESRASEIREIRRGLAENQPIRFTRRNAPPEGWGTALLHVSDIRPDALRQAEAVAAERAEAFRDRIETLYRYDLILRNCVTELVRAVDSAFPSIPAAEAALGGYLQPGEGLSFIPYRFFDLAPRHYRIESTTLLPSYRNRMLRQFAERDAGWTVLAAEASTWTSSLYEPQPGDSLFLLFTEDMFWPRPLFGAVNLVYGLGESAVGLLTAPFDDGRRLREGLRGALFSLPELAFGNIRKGSFDGIRSRAERNSEAGD
jgi:hypothetical protein